MNQIYKLSSILLLLCSCSLAFAVEETLYRGLGNASTQFSDFKTLKQKGFLANKPTIARADYNDVYMLKKPYTFLGQKFVLLSDEYMSEYVGCCVNEGWGAVFAKTSDLKKIEQFAQKNQCKIEKMQSNSEYYGYSLSKLGKAEYYELSCREGDVE